LIAAIRLKAIESYITIEKQVLPLCITSKTQKPLRIIFTVVIDEDGIDSMEETLAELAGVKTVRDNYFFSIKQALSRLNKQTSMDGSTYYYDAIEVLSAQDYSNQLKRSM
jgi:hypothetical protein